MTNLHKLTVAVIATLGIAGCLLLKTRPVAAADAQLPTSYLPIPGGDRVIATAVGHEYRQDDWPSIATAPDGSVWVAWLSFDGNRDDIAIRRCLKGHWSNLQWVPNTSGDSWMPQVAVDAANRVWVVWSQQVNGNWDLYARNLDTRKQEWSALERLTSDPLPDINPRLTANAQGQFALVWQGYRGKNSNIFLKTFDGRKWSADVRVTDRAANDWEPAVALDGKGDAWVAYDSYRKGNYDLFVSAVRSGAVQPEMTVADTPGFEARATVAVDTSGRVWVAWEAGQPNWGKDLGWVILGHHPGGALGGARDARIRCYEGGQWKVPEPPLAAAFQKENTFQPHVFSDGAGSVWVAAKVLLTRPGGSDQIHPANARGYWEYWLTRFEGKRWSPAFALSDSKGRSSTRINGTLGKDGRLWLAWPTDNRSDKFYQRPIREQVYAAPVPAPAAADEAHWKSGGDEPVEVKPGHANEPEDVRAIRAYTVPLDGKNQHILRGDFHRHTELSWDTIQPDGSLQDFYRYMIDVASMDFGASTDHQGGVFPYSWWYSQKMTDMYHAPGAYIPIFGYERSAVYPNGHRNVFFARRSDSRVTHFFLKQGTRDYDLPLSPQGDEPAIAAEELVANDTKLLYEEIRGRNSLVISHTPATQMGTDWRDNDPALEPVVEIYQGCRTSYEQVGAPWVARPEDTVTRYLPAGMLSNAWGKGYKLGVIASSDHFSTHMSYAMVYTADPTRQGILDAIRKRHTYGAMDNIILDVRTGGHFMGDEFKLAKAQPIQVKVRGTRVVAKVDVIKDSRVVYSVEPGQQNVQFEFTDKESGTGRHYYYVRVQQDDKMLAWSSPMFITYE